MPATQDNKEIGIGTPLGKDVLLLQSASIREELGRPFQIEAELLSENPNVDFNALVGENVTIRLNLADDSVRYFNGCISRFQQARDEGNFARYRAVIVPWLWFLTRTSDCRIFQNMTVPEIIKQVFNDAGFPDFRDGLTGSYPTWEYCVQYRETSFNFISRLMEQEGIYYFFEHENGKHTLVLADAYSAHSPYPGFADMLYRPPSRSMPDRDCITDWVVERNLQPGNYVLNDFNFEKVKTALLRNSTVSRSHNRAGYEIYDYPGEYSEPPEGEQYAKVRIEELQAQFETAHGNTTIRGVCTGSLFTLQDHPRDDQNREYLITGAQYQLDAGTYETAGGTGGGQNFYSCSFTAVESQTPFRPARLTPKPLIQGPQTAMVVGPQGDEIHTDKYGRVKVQFHWDRYGQRDENSSCWMRVAHSWAGKNWGIIFTPRIGQEVIVEFLEGDPDHPIITGRVYNSEAMPPYELPAEGTKSTLKSNSSVGGAGFNEIRFEDKKGEEQIFIHGENDQDVRIKNDHLEWIGNDRHQIVKANQYESVEADKHSLVKGDHLSKVEGDRGITVEGDRLAKVTGSDHLTVDADGMEKIGGDKNSKITGNWNADAGQKISIKSGTDFHEKAGTNYAMDAGMAVHIKGGMKVVIEAGMQVSLKAGSNFIDIGPAGIAISGTPTVMINSGGSAGSGDGSSPTAPAEPTAPTEPTEPTEADDGEPGQVDEPLEPPEPPQPVTYSSAATVLQTASRSGTPFCET